MLPKPSARPPRLLTPYTRTPLDLLMSTGLSSVNVAVYATLPLALRGAKLMSVMTALRGSRGSSSPAAVPRTCSYAPTSPNTRPLNAYVVLLIVICVTRASATGAATTNAPAAATAIMARLGFAGINMVQTLRLDRNSRDTDYWVDRHAATLALCAGKS